MRKLKLKQKEEYQQKKAGARVLRGVRFRKVCYVPVPIVLVFKE